MRFSLRQCTSCVRCVELLKLEISCVMSGDAQVDGVDPAVLLIYTVSQLLWPDRHELLFLLVQLNHPTTSHQLYYVRNKKLSQVSFT